MLAVYAYFNNYKIMNLKDLQKKKIERTSGRLQKVFKLYPEHRSTERITYFDHPETIVAVHIKIGDKHGKYWNDTKEVLLDAHYKGYAYRLGLDKYKSERSLVLRINNFVKHIVNDTQAGGV